MMGDLIAVAIAYALGCVQTGYYLVRGLTGEDLRRTGSGSTGARNTGRVLGWWGFVLALLGDAGKGALAVAVSGWLGTSSLTAPAALVAVTAGHVWPVQLRFSGGRGVAVGLGSLAVFDLRLLGVLATVTVLAYAACRRFQAGGLAGFAALPLAAWLFRLPAQAVAGITCMSLVVLFAHRAYLAGCIRPAPAADGGPSATPGD